MQGQDFHWAVIRDKRGRDTESQLYLCLQGVETNKIQNIWICILRDIFVIISAILYMGDYFLSHPVCLPAHNATSAKGLIVKSRANSFLLQ